MSMLMTRLAPPFAGGIRSPLIVASGVRMKLFARSLSWASVRWVLLIPSWRIGTLVALNRTTIGGKTPGGIVLITCCDTAVILRHARGEVRLRLKGRPG